jgi:hypothetical protein
MIREQEWEGGKWVVGKKKEKKKKVTWVVGEKKERKK